nr:hypothetical protein [Tanacetum cinerariifolium]
TSRRFGSPPSASGGSSHLVEIDPRLGGSSESRRDSMVVAVETKWRGSSNKKGNGYKLWCGYWNIKDPYGLEGSWWICKEVQLIVTVKEARFEELLSCLEGNHEEQLRAYELYKEAK